LLLIAHCSVLIAYDCFTNLKYAEKLIIKQDVLSFTTGSSVAPLGLFTSNAWRDIRAPQTTAIGIAWRLSDLDHGQITVIFGKLAKLRQGVPTIMVFAEPPAVLCQFTFRRAAALSATNLISKVYFLC
jgi:hypothetical protein